MITRRLIAILAGTALLILALWLVYARLTASPKAEAHLSRNQAEAASQNGADAVNVVGANAASEAASDDLTRSNADAIRKAPGADATVAPTARDAGLAALCRRAAYRESPRCAH